MSKSILLNMREFQYMGNEKFISIYSTFPSSIIDNHHQLYFILRDIKNTIFLKICSEV